MFILAAVTWLDNITLVVYCTSLSSLTQGRTWYMEEYLYYTHTLRSSLPLSLMNSLTFLEIHGLWPTPWIALWWLCTNLRCAWSNIHEYMWQHEKGSQVIISYTEWREWSGGTCGSNAISNCLGTLCFHYHNLDHITIMEVHNIILSHYAHRL